MFTTETAYGSKSVTLREDIYSSLTVTAVYAEVFIVLESCQPSDVNTFLHLRSLLSAALPLMPHYPVGGSSPALQSLYPIFVSEEEINRHWAWEEQQAWF